MKQSVIAVLLSLFALVACAHEQTPAQDQISVVGVGEVEREPDQATLNISVTAQQATLAAAKQQADQQYRSVLMVIQQSGIDKKDVKATRISAQPQHEWRNGKRIYKGERVSRSLSIKVNDLDKVSPLMQALVDNGVSTIDGISTGFKDRKALQQAALAVAADDARAKAEFLAERLDRHLGKAFLISEHNRDAPVVVQRRELQLAEGSYAKADTAPPEMFGTQKVQATVNVSFDLL